MIYEKKCKKEKGFKYPHGWRTAPGIPGSPRPDVHPGVLRGDKSV